MIVTKERIGLPSFDFDLQAYLVVLTWVADRY